MIRFLIEKEFKLFRRNSFMPRLLIVMPMLTMLILPFAANMEIREINLTVVDADRSTLSSRFIERLAASPNFNFVEFADSHSQALQSIESNRSDIILEIPHDFARDAITGSANIQIAANAVNAIKSSMASSYLTSIVNDFARDISSSAGVTLKPTIEIATQNRFNPTLNYRFFMVPALMVMLLTIMCGFLPALNIVWEKESGTIEQMNVTPVSKLTFIISKLIPYWIIGFAVLSLSFLLALIIHAQSPAGSLYTLYFGSTLFVLAISGMGLVISNYSQTMQQAMFVMFFFTLILLLLSGSFTPIQSMPEWAQRITIVNPLKYFIEIMRGVYLKGSTPADIAPQLGALSLFALVLNGWAIISYRKSS